MIDIIKEELKVLEKEYNGLGMKVSFDSEGIVKSISGTRSPAASREQEKSVILATRINLLRELLVKANSKP